MEQDKAQVQLLQSRQTENEELLLRLRVDLAKVNSEHTSSCDEVGRLRLEIEQATQRENQLKQEMDDTKSYIDSLETSLRSKSDVEKQLMTVRNERKELIAAHQAELGEL